MNREVVGRRIRIQREKLSLTREKFAELIELSPRFLGEVENGTKGMTADTLYKICSQVEESADYILMGRQATGNLKTPAAKMLSAIPPEYTEMIEGVLRAFLQTIQVAESKHD